MNLFFLSDRALCLTFNQFLFHFAPASRLRLRHLLDSPLRSLRCLPCRSFPADSGCHCRRCLAPLLLALPFPLRSRCCLAMSIATIPDVADVERLTGGPGQGQIRARQSTYSKWYRRLPLRLYSPLGGEVRRGCESVNREVSTVGTTPTRPAASVIGNV